MAPVPGWGARPEGDARRVEAHQGPVWSTAGAGPLGRRPQSRDSMLAIEAAVGSLVDLRHYRTAQSPPWSLNHPPKVNRDLNAYKNFISVILAKPGIDILSSHQDENALNLNLHLERPNQMVIQNITSFMLKYFYGQE